jgi:hypothetical protein
MTYNFRRFAAALAASMAFAMPASATSFSTDYTDLWFNPAESGWGVNLIQQGNTLFATLFVYGPDQTARWYVASGLVGSSTTTFTGPLFRTTGPYFGAPWTGGGPATNVGSMSFVFNTPTTGTLTYVVDGVNVQKSIQRQTFVANNIGGAFLGGLTAQSSACSSGQNNPILIFNQFTVSHNAANQISMPCSSSPATARPPPAPSPAPTGRTASRATSSAPGAAPPGNAGAFNITQIDVTIHGWTGRFSGNDQFCTYNGNFGGVRDVI